MVSAEADDQFEKAIAYAEEIRSMAEQLLAAKEKDLNRLREAMDTLVLTGGRLKDLANQKFPENDSSMKKARVVALSDSLCALGGNIHIQIASGMRLKSGADAPMVRYMNIKNKNES